MIYADFQSILVPKHNGKQNPNESYTKKCQKHTASGYSHKLVCANDKFCKPFKLYLGEDDAFNFINSMTKKSK